MTTYKELYFHLFNTLTDAIDDLEQGHIINAIYRMKQAQIQTEVLGSGENRQYTPDENRQSQPN